MNLNAEIKAVIRDMFRVGKVVSTNPDKVTVRVKFDDADEFVSGDLQVLNRKTLEDKDLQMPDIGELVACLFLGSGQISGYVLGSVYNGGNEPPANSQDKWVKEFKDGTRFEYDRAEHRLDLKVNGDANLNVAGNITATAEIATIEASTANVNCKEVNLGVDASAGVLHAQSPCPIYGAFHTNPSQTTKTAL